jgi:DNA-binding XRE family transcriptional regulator
VSVTNQRQYRVTVAAIRRFEQALKAAEQEYSGRDPVLAKAVKEGIAGEIEVLRQQVDDYLEMRKETGPYRMSSFDEIPDVLIRARVAKGLTQKELAKRLGIKPQQVQRYEAGHYAHASLARVQQVAHCLDVRVAGVSLRRVKAKRATGPRRASARRLQDEPTA